MDPGGRKPPGLPSSVSGLVLALLGLFVDACRVAAEEGDEVVASAAPCRSRTGRGRCRHIRSAWRPGPCLATTRPVASIGTVLSDGAVDDQRRHAVEALRGRAGNRSWRRPCAAARVGRSPAIIVWRQAFISTSSLTGWLMKPAPKKSLKKPLKKCAAVFLHALRSSRRRSTAGRRRDCRRSAACRGRPS